MPWGRFPYKLEEIESVVVVPQVSSEPYVKSEEKGWTHPFTVPGRSVLGSTAKRPAFGPSPPAAGKPWCACTGVPRPASSLQHPSPQHPWLWQAPAHHSSPLPAHIADPHFMRSQVRARVSLCSSTASTSSPTSRTLFLEATSPVPCGHARSLAFSPPHPPFRSLRLLIPPCAIDLCAGYSW